MKEVDQNASSLSSYDYSLRLQEQQSGAISGEEGVTTYSRQWGGDSLSLHEPLYSLLYGSDYTNDAALPFLPQPRDTSGNVVNYSSPEEAHQTLEEAYKEFAQAHTARTLNHLTQQHGLSTEENGTIRFFLDHPDLIPADESLAEFINELRSNEEKGFQAEHEGEVPDEWVPPKASLVSDEQLGHIWEQQHERLLQEQVKKGQITKDEVDALRYAFSKNPRGTELGRQALNEARGIHYFPEDFFPPVDSNAMEENVNYTLAFGYEKALKGLDPKQISAARMMHYAPEWLNAIPEGERGPYIKGQEINNQLPVMGNLRTQFGLPKNWQPNNSQRSIYEARLMGDFVATAQRNFRSFSENPINPETGKPISLTPDELNNIFLGIFDHNLELPPEHRAIAMNFYDQAVLQTQQKHALPPGWAPPLESADLGVILDPKTLKTNTVLDQTDKDIATAEAHVKGQPDSPEKSMFLDYLKRVSMALADMRDALYIIQQIDSNIAKSFSKVELEAILSKIQEQQAKQKKMEKKQKKAREMNQWMEPIKFIGYGLLIVMSFYTGGVLGVLVASLLIADRETAGDKGGYTQKLFDAIDEIDVGVPGLNETLQQLTKVAVLAAIFVASPAVAFDVALQEASLIQDGAKPMFMAMGAPKDDAELAAEITAMVIIMAAEGGFMHGAGSLKAAGKAGTAGQKVGRLTRVTQGVARARQNALQAMMNAIKSVARSSKLLRKMMDAMQQLIQNLIKTFKALLRAVKSSDEAVEAATTAQKASDDLAKGVEGVTQKMVDDLTVHAMEMQKIADDALGAFQDASKTLGRTQRSIGTVQRKVGQTVLEVRRSFAQTFGDDDAAKMMFAVLGIQTMFSAMSTGASIAYNLTMMSLAKTRGRLESFLAEMDSLIRILRKAIKNMYDSMAGEGSYQDFKSGIDSQLNQFWATQAKASTERSAAIMTRG